MSESHMFALKTWNYKVVSIAIYFLGSTFFILCRCIITVRFIVHKYCLSIFATPFSISFYSVSSKNTRKMSDLDFSTNYKLKKL